MQRRTRRTWLVPTLAALPLALATALAGHEAHASGFQLKENSVQGLGRAYAGGAAAPGDCSVVVNNPAAMGDLGEANCFQADLNVINFSTEFKGSGTDFLGRPLVHTEFYTKALEAFAERVEMKHPTEAVLSLDTRLLEMT